MTKEQIGIAVIGTGIQARRRLESLTNRIDSKAVFVTGRRKAQTKSLAEKYSVQYALDWKDAVRSKDTQAVMICTPPHTHLEISTFAMKSGVHVLCEKPMALTVKEGEQMLAMSGKYSVVLKSGFNIRYHPGILKLKEWTRDPKIIGNLYFIRSRFGHGGKIGYDSGWRASPKLVGGGQLWEHGIHVVDLFRMFLGDFDTATGFMSTNYWPIRPLEDNALAIFRRNEGGQIAFLHSSLTQWRNLFSFEIGGENAIASVEGLGRASGVERATLCPREFDKPFREETIEFRGEDNSWSSELTDFVNSIRSGKEPSGSGKDAVEALRMVSAAYESAKRLETVAIK